MISGIIHVIRNGLRWKDAPSAYGPHKTLYNRFRRWAEKGVFQRIFVALAAERASDGTLILDATHKAHCTAASLLLKKGAQMPRTHLGRTEFQTARRLQRRRQVIDFVADRRTIQRLAFGLPEHLPPGTTLIADKAYESHRLRHALRARKIRPCIPVRKGQWDDDSFDPRLYRQRNVIKRFFGRLKDFQRIAMRYDRCPISFFTTITIAAIVTAFL